MPGKKRDIEEIYEPYPLKKRVPLSRAYPEVAALWDYKLNCGFGPEDFSSGANVLAWFRCPKGPDHIFKTVIFTAVRSFRSGNNGCPFCANKKLSVTNSLVKLRPDLAKEFMEKRNKKKVKEVIAGGASRYWWQCQNNSKHTWLVSLNSRISRDTGCPKCGIGDTIDLRRYPKVLAQFDLKRNKGVVIGVKLNCVATTIRIAFFQSCFSCFLEAAFFLDAAVALKLSPFNSRIVA